MHLLQTYPGLSAVKVLRKLKAKVDQLDVSDRSVRRYIQGLKDEISFKQTRYYEPVIDMMPGVQCQVDGGELRSVLIGVKDITVYFMVFVLSYSRLMQVSVSARPIDTQALIHQQRCKRSAILAACHRNVCMIKRNGLLLMKSSANWS